LPYNDKPITVGLTTGSWNNFQLLQEGTMTDTDYTAQGEPLSPFMSAYTKILIEAWTNDEYAARLDSDPVEAIREFGLEVPEGANLLVTRVIPEEHAEPSEEGAAAKWENGVVTGTYVLSVQEIPQVDLDSLTEEDLLAIAAGWSVSCCSCTPCCCCA